jgi:hypothetical protein
VGVGVGVGVEVTVFVAVSVGTGAGAGVHAVKRRTPVISRPSPAIEEVFTGKEYPSLWGINPDGYSVDRCTG